MGGAGEEGQSSPKGRRRVPARQRYHKLCAYAFTASPHKLPHHAHYRTSCSVLKRVLYVAAATGARSRAERDRRHGERARNRRCRGGRAPG
eukprot:1483524-Rhodomonas_salina.1